MTFVVDGTNGLTFNNSTTQASAGVVLQVVNGTYSTSASTGSGTFVDSGLTANITPKFSTSKILVLVSQTGLYKTAANVANGVNLRLVRNSTAIDSFGLAIGYTGTAIENITTASTSYLDSPATTSSVTYKTQFASYSNTNAAYVQANNDTSTITLLEIAA